MTKTDVALLEWLDELDENAPADAAPPKQIHAYLGDAPTYDHVSRRLRTLEDAGLLERRVRGMYAISPLGKRYLHDPDATVDEFLRAEDEDEDESDE